MVLLLKKLKLFCLILLIKTNEDLIGISYTSLIPILIEGIKELNKNNQEIRTELNQMKEDMKQMKELLNQFMQKV